jgi:hypothetical protein
MNGIGDTSGVAAFAVGGIRPPGDDAGESRKGVAHGVRVAGRI